MYSVLTGGMSRSTWLAAPGVAALVLVPAAFAMAEPAGAPGDRGPDLATCRFGSSAISGVEAGFAGDPEFYSIELVPTGRVPGTGNVRGTVAVKFARTPFDFAVSNGGTFHRRLELDLSGLQPPREGEYVVWVAPPNLTPVKRLGTLGEEMKLVGDVAFPKFLVIVTLEREPDRDAERWTGPVVHRGMSRSGFMHTMAGHGPFEQEPCAGYGFQ